MTLVVIMVAFRGKWRVDWVSAMLRESIEIPIYVCLHYKGPFLKLVYSSILNNDPRKYCVLYCLSNVDPPKILSSKKGNVLTGPRWWLPRL